jgi:hypothetical protein
MALPYMERFRRKRKKENWWCFRWSQREGIYLTTSLEKVQDQDGVTPNMRGILVDWLIKIAVAWKLLPDTLHCSISYVDRFLSLNAVNTQKLQLLAMEFLQCSLPRKLASKSLKKNVYFISMGFPLTHES